MGKALLVGTSLVSYTTGSFLGLFGNAANLSSEASCQYSATEDAKFTGLRAKITTGGSGTNTLRFRDAGADGQNVAQLTGSGFLSDKQNTDSLTAGDLFAVSYVDTGSNSTIRYRAANVEMASGHGSFHAAQTPSTGALFSLPSTTRYPTLMAGTISTSTSVTDAQWKNRGYTSIEAFQVNVLANARTTDTVFRVNVNGTHVGTAITYAAGATGLQTVTGLGLTIASGDLICAAVVTLAGTETITVAMIGATLKSSTNSSESMCISVPGVVRAASATPNYQVIGGSLVDGGSTTEADVRIPVGFPARSTNLRCYLSANTYTADATLTLRVNGVSRITTTITAGGGAGWYENTTDFVDIVEADELSFEIVGGTSGSISVRQIGITFAPRVAGTTTVRMMFDRENEARGWVDYSANRAGWFDNALFMPKPIVISDAVLNSLMMMGHGL